MSPVRSVTYVSSRTLGTTVRLTRKTYPSSSRYRVSLRSAVMINWDLNSVFGLTIMPDVERVGIGTGDRARVLRQHTGHRASEVKLCVDGIILDV